MESFKIISTTDEFIRICNIAKITDLTVVLALKLSIGISNVLGFFFKYVFSILFHYSLLQEVSTFILSCFRTFFGKLKFTSEKVRGPK